jgi:YaiO family outer membrane protein
MVRGHGVNGARWLVALMTSLGTVPGQAAAQASSGSGTSNMLSAIHEHTFISSAQPGWTDWTETRVGLVHTLARGALGGEVARVGRFGLVDVALTADTYVETWSGAYANIRGRVTPQADVLPRWDVYAEVFQSLGGGWEASASAWRMNVPAADVSVFGAGIGCSAGAWYLRAVGRLSRSAGSDVGSTLVSVRRYLGDSRQLVEVSGATGREVVVLGAGPVVALRRTTSAQVRAQRFLTSAFGASGALSFGTFEGAPDRVGLSVGLLARF